MQSSLFLIFAFVAITAVESHPAFQKKLNNMINGNPCLKHCMDIVKESDLELSVVKTVDFANYFVRLEEICSVIEKARNCIDNCGIQSNPFKLNSMTVMCAESVRKETEAFANCMKEEGQKVMGICENQCGIMKNVSDEIEKRTAQLHASREADTQHLFNGVMEKTNEACGMMKCFARCSRSAFSQLCATSTPSDAGEFMYSFVERVNQAMLLDLEQQQVKETMMQSMPVQCNYMHTAQMMFNETADQSYLLEFERQIAIQKKAFNSDSNANVLAALQKTVLTKELEVLEKRERLIAKESKKLDMEMAVIQGRSSF